MKKKLTMHRDTATNTRILEHKIPASISDLPNNPNTNTPALTMNHAPHTSATEKKDTPMSSLFRGSKTDFVHAYPDVALRIFTQTKKHAQNSDALNHESPEHEYVIYIPTHTIHDTPLAISMLNHNTNNNSTHTSNLDDNASLSSLFNHTQISEKIIVIVEKNASVHFYDQPTLPHTSTLPHTPGLRDTPTTQITHTINRTIEYWIGDHAHISVLYNQQLPLSVKETAQIDCYMGAHSSLSIQCLISGSAHSTTTVNLHAHHTHAHVRVRGAYILQKNQQAHISVYQNHTAAQTQSDVIVKSILQDHAQFTYSGLIYIDKNAPHTDAVQQNKNMLLGTNARAHSKPSLEILTNEVRCAHGSAVGYLDAEQLFYLQSRGLSLDIAQYILMQGFIAELFTDTAHSMACDLIRTLKP